MNLVSKCALTAMTLALDFAAGSALDRVWDANWFGANADEVRLVETAAYRDPLPTLHAAMNRPDLKTPHTGGGVCKPSERSVMVMELDQLSAEAKARPRHVCIRALSGEPEVSLQVRDFPTLAAEQ
ncbi:hypothetical protein EOI86_10670 [Hwanghaeella grinnelliae]|uniref:Uncharacterized protein n=1 Tax=Hwanghaeella grinnelliae TaxID=2500179 RepID=A0A437QYR3_9PROT|nr:hypothetical protein [Hwanghaeella grinnelliae]RVU39658.1 hypothetical protein EOI86_10670 [Hwanghaeella grinnelliae]